MPWEKLLRRPTQEGHLVQLYGSNEASLIANVGHYLHEGSAAGDGLLVIATPGHIEQFRRKLEELGTDADALMHGGRLAFFDAQEMLSRFMVAGTPDWERFQREVGSAIFQVRAAGVRSGLRAYGEMVGILWKARQFSAAIRLEQFWNKLLSRSSFNLYCAYAIDVFGKDFQVSALDALLCNHTHVLPADTDGNLETALNLAMEEILGSKSEDLKVLIKANHRPSWGVLPAGESTILWLKGSLPRESEPILLRAREHYNRLQMGGGRA